MPPSRAVTPWYLDKALYVTVLSLLLPLVGPRLGLDLDPMKVASALLVAVAYVVGHKWKSGKVLLAELALEAQRAARQAAQSAWGTSGYNAQAQANLQQQAAYRLDSPLGGPLKTLLVLAALAVALPAPARAGGFDWSTGPTIPVLRYDLASPVPVQVAAGAGLQLSLTHDALKRDFLGKSWDLVSANVMGFGSIINGDGHQFGALSAALGVCFFSSLACVDYGHDVLTSDQRLARGPGFLLLAFSFNFALSPTAPASFDKDSWRLPRANTLYLFGGP